MQLSYVTSITSGAFVELLSRILMEEYVATGEVQLGAITYGSAHEGHQQSAGVAST